MMIGIERRLAQVTGTKDRPITTILDNPKENAADKSVQVRFKVNKYWKEELLEKHWGVKVRFKPAPPTTAPATAPASAPAGATAPAAVAG